MFTILCRHVTKSIIYLLMLLFSVHVLQQLVKIGSTSDFMVFVLCTDIINDICSRTEHVQNTINQASPSEDLLMRSNTVMYYTT